METRYYQFMTPMWLKQQESAAANERLIWGADAKINDVAVYVAADTRFNESVFRVPLIQPDGLEPDKSYVVQINAGLEYKTELSYGSAKGGKNEDSQSDTIAKILGQIRALTELYTALEARVTKVESEIASIKSEVAALRAQVAQLQAALRWQRRDPMCIMISDREKAIGCEIRDPSGYTKYGPYRGVQGIYGERGLIGSRYIADEGQDFLDGILEPVQSNRWPQLFRMNLVVNDEGACWGTISSDIDGGHSVSIAYDEGLYDASSNGLYFTVYRGERNEAYNINYFEITVLQ